MSKLRFLLLAALLACQHAESDQGKQTELDDGVEIDPALVVSPASLEDEAAGECDASVEHLEVAEPINEPTDTSIVIDEDIGFYLDESGLLVGFPSGDILIFGRKCYPDCPEGDDAVYYPGGEGDLQLERDVFYLYDPKDIDKLSEYFSEVPKAESTLTSGKGGYGGIHFRTEPIDIPKFRGLSNWNDFNVPVKPIKSDIGKLLKEMIQDGVRKQNIVNRDIQHRLNQQRRESESMLKMLIHFEMNRKANVLIELQNQVEEVAKEVVKYKTQEIQHQQEIISMMDAYSNNPTMSSVVDGHDSKDIYLKDLDNELIRKRETFLADFAADNQQIIKHEDAISENYLNAVSHYEVLADEQEYFDRQFADTLDDADEDRKWDYLVASEEAIECPIENCWTDHLVELANELNFRLQGEQGGNRDIYESALAHLMDEVFLRKMFPEEDFFPTTLVREVGSLSSTTDNSYALETPKNNANYEKLEKILNYHQFVQNLLNETNHHQEERQYLLDMAEVMVHAADYNYKQASLWSRFATELGDKILANAYHAIDLALDFIPGVSLGKDLLSLYYDENIITGEKLEELERTLMVVAAIIPGPIKHLALKSKTVKYSVEKIAHTSKNLQNWIKSSSPEFDFLIKHGDVIEKAFFFKRSSALC